MRECRCRECDELKPSHTRLPHLCEYCGDKGEYYSTKKFGQDDVYMALLGVCMVGIAIFTVFQAY